MKLKGIDILNISEVFSFLATKEVNLNTAVTIVNNIKILSVPKQVLDEKRNKIVADCALKENGQVATQYVDVNGNPTMDEDFNPNGSYYAIEGITSPDGRVLGKMAHSERRGDGVALNICGDQNQLIFESGVQYFK